METFPDGLWKTEPGKMATVDKMKQDGSVETVRAVYGHFIHHGAVKYECQWNMYYWLGSSCAFVLCSDDDNVRV
jgi:hypothetical protein